MYVLCKCVCESSEIIGSTDVKPLKNVSRGCNFLQVSEYN